MDTAFKNFFRKTASFPKFKSKYNKQSFSLPQSVKVDFKSDHIHIPKIGSVLAILHRKFEGEIKTCTFSKTKTGKYFCSVLVEDGKPAPNKCKVDKVTGIDLGIKDFITFSNGDKISGERPLKDALCKLQRLQQKLSGKVKGSNNYRKLKRCIASLLEYISNCRADNLHKLSSRIIDENQAIIVEDLNVKKMLEDGHKNLSRSIGDASWGIFVNMLEYKAEWRGKHFHKVPSKTHQGCVLIVV